ASRGQAGVHARGLAMRQGAPVQVREIAFVVEQGAVDVRDDHSVRGGRHIGTEVIIFGPPRPSGPDVMLIIDRPAPKTYSWECVAGLRPGFPAGTGRPRRWKPKEVVSWHPPPFSSSPWKSGRWARISSASWSSIFRRRCPNA